MNPDRFRTRSLEDAAVMRIIAAAVEAVDPGRLVRQHLHILPRAVGRIFALGIGKAASSMVQAVLDELPASDALVITKHPVPTIKARAQIIEAGHPIPDERSVDAGRQAIEFASRVGPQDLLIVLVSGGGSALAVAPLPGVTLADLQWLTARLIEAGANIEDLNTVRRRLDAIKGGGLARAARGTVVGMILSDVPEGRPEAVASGPTIDAQETPAEPAEIIDKLGIRLPPALDRALRASPPRGSRQGASPRNVVVGDSSIALQAAIQQAGHEGFEARALEMAVVGEAREAGVSLARRLARLGRGGKQCLVGAGETTVKVVGPGRGGRNQEVALAAAEGMSRIPSAMLVALATDGEDGPTDTAGAVATGATHQRGRDLGMESGAYLDRNDSYAYFDGLGDLLRPGITGTNVSDLCFLFRW